MTEAGQLGKVSVKGVLVELDTVVLEDSGIHTDTTGNNPSLGHLVWPRTAPQLRDLVIAKDQVIVHEAARWTGILIQYYAPLVSPST